MFTLDMKPLELASIIVVEKQADELSRYTQEKLVFINPQYLLKAGKYSMTIIFDETTKLTKRVTFETSDGSFRKFHLFESVVNYPGDDTFSCTYLF
jgi:hypothetical protein